MSLPHTLPHERGEALVNDVDLRTIFEKSFNGVWLFECYTILAGSNQVITALRNCFMTVKMLMCH